VVINIVEPIDLLTLLVQETLGGDRFKVIGVGGLLSSTRIRYLVSKALGVSPREVTGLIIGPHHPSMVFLRDTIRVSGIPAAALLSEPQLLQLIEDARNAGDTILQLAQRSTSYYAPSAAAAILVDAIVCNTRALLPVSVRCEGEYGVQGLAIGVPAFVGERGVDRILQLKLSAADRDAFDRAAAALQAAHDNLAAGAA
jgi:malate dehydrogenase